jgi:broad specificity phosphatase PhoE
MSAWRWVFFVLVFAAGCAAQPPAPAPVAPDCVESEPTVVAFVRHAEKASDGTNDPPLTKVGRQRSTCLAEVLGTWDADHLWATQYQRTQATLEPLASATSIAVDVMEADATQDWVAAIHQAPAGSRIVVSAHSNTIPEIVSALGGDPGPLDAKGHIPSDEYDRLVFVVLRGDEHSVTLRQRYCTR